MTIILTREEAQEILEALTYVGDAKEIYSDTIEILRARLAQPEPEPVAWMYVNADGECEQIEYGEVLDDPSVTQLYTSPPQREWQGLTDEEIEQIVDQYWEDPSMFTEAIEAKLKQKNA